MRPWDWRFWRRRSPPPREWTLPFEEFRWNEQPLAVYQGRIYARLGKGAGEEKAHSRRGVCLELASGKVLGVFAADYGGDACILVAGDRGIADRDGSHNTNTLHLA